MVGPVRAAVPQPKPSKEPYPVMVCETARWDSGGFIVTVSPVGQHAPEAQRLIALTAAARLRELSESGVGRGPDRGVGVGARIGRLALIRVAVARSDQRKLCTK
jgi:hypothetical protein